MNGGLGPATHPAWAGGMQSAQADSDPDGLVPTVCNGLAPAVCNGLVPAVHDGLVPMVCSSLVLVVDNSLVLTGCSAWAGSVRSVQADSDVLGVVRALQYGQMWRRMPGLGGSARWSTVSG